MVLGSCGADANCHEPGPAPDRALRASPGIHSPQGVRGMSPARPGEKTATSQVHPQRHGLGACAHPRPLTAPGAREEAGVLEETDTREETGVGEGPCRLSPSTSLRSCLSNPWRAPRQARCDRMGGAGSKVFLWALPAGAGRRLRVRARCQASGRSCVRCCCGLLVWEEGRIRGGRKMPGRGPMS